MNKETPITSDDYWIISCGEDSIKIDASKTFTITGKYGRYYVSIEDDFEVENTMKTLNETLIETSLKEIDNMSMSARAED